MVKIRLARRGRKKLSLFDIVVADARAPRDGKFIEKIGSYNPGTNPATVVLNEERAFYWIMNGAQPTDTARSLLSQKGVMYRKHLQVGVKKGAITQETADKKLEEWLKRKQEQLIKKIEELSKKSETSKKSRLEAEVLTNKKREEAIKAKKAAATQEPLAETNQAPSENAETPAEHPQAE
ncbi:MAG: 30S ribosomal protein S16 [Cytophagaceae bacterium]|nr:30S ribosomal protein S16 [Cytophagaceae bacterium]MDW8456445.1 30S ribosomal protein S16 [Cytophagaceae bacterium]